MRIDNYSPEICSITYPLLKHYAHKIGAEFYEINERKYPDWPIPYETFQIYELMKERDDDWAIWIDADALVNPETPDWTCYVPTDTCAQNGNDASPIRWQYDEYLRRDGRHISSCNWHAIVPKDCRDFMRPLDDLSLDEAVDRISVTVQEANGTCPAPHLISDFTVSRNIARFGLKYTTFREIGNSIFPDGNEFYFHLYAIPDEEKIDQMLLTLNRWLGGLYNQKHFLKWDNETEAYMIKRLALARERAEMKMFYEQVKAQLISYKEQEISANAIEYVKKLTGGNRLSADDIAKHVEQLTKAAIAK